ncbi:hypothetical protein AAFX91_41065 [Bradyrhizobium sp. 31Argb]|uniref:hypothetical protein n=1 Tax=Bradyrhizobium sp. 31Argb TaxID=3141247 RepID=UPI00374A7FA5
MIDASTFAISFNAFWHAYTPTCEHFVRRLNLGGLNRFDRPMTQPTKTTRRAVIAEYAFSIFVERRESSWAGSYDSKGQRETAWSKTVGRLAQYSDQGLDVENRLNEEEDREVSEIANRLGRFFDGSRPVVLRPMFTGCGYVDASEGDVLFGSTLYEVKTVERPVRSSDIRQTITYAALNSASGSKQFEIQNVGLFNPRRGQYCDISVEHICSEISGRPAQELFAVIVQALSSGEISR